MAEIARDPVKAKCAERGGNCVRHMDVDVGTEPMDEIAVLDDAIRESVQFGPDAAMDDGLRQALCGAAAPC